MIAARQIAFGKAAGAKYTAADYVFRSPVQHWDGIENVGYNAHDDNSTTWNSLVEGGMNLSLGEYGGWSDNALLCLGGRIPAYSNTKINKGVVRHISIVVEAESTKGLICMLGQGANNGAILVAKLSATTVAVTTALSVSVGISNCVTVDSNKYCISINYDEQGLIVDAYVNGVKQNPEYSFFSSSSIAFSVGDRQNDSSNPFTGKVHRIMIGGEHLTESEIAHNYEIDKARFNI
jgi:hypothetical protein